MTLKKNRNEFLGKSEKREIEELAEFIACSISTRGIVDVEQIAINNGITFSYGNYSDSFDGLIEHKNGKFHIYINIDRLNHPYTERARFTFAHELGHYFIDNHRNALSQGLTPSHPSFTGFKSENLVERQADFFASCLLLPKSRLEQDCSDRYFEFVLLQELAKKYNVSFTATALRYTRLNFHPIMVICIVNDRIKWYWFSDDFPFKVLRHGKDKVPYNTVAGEYCYQQKKYDMDEVIFAKEWFAIDYRPNLDREFFERCIYGKDKVLSIIWED